MTVLVTGANGLLGNNLIRALCAKKIPVRGMVRQSSDLRSLQGLPVELAYGDVRDADALKAAATGCDLLFHTAAVFSYWGYSREEMIQTAEEGARNTVNAAQAAGIKRIILTASSSVLGPNWSRTPLTEEDGSDLEGTLDYFYTKGLQEKLTLECGREAGIEVISVCPAVFIGPYDFRPSASLPTLTDYLFDPFKLTYPGGVNLVHVQDVVEAHLLLADKGIPFERYLVGGENLTWRNLHELIAETGGVSKPRLCMGRKAAYMGAAMMELGAKITGKPPMGTRATARMVGSYFWYDDAKIRALGFKSRSAQETLADTLAWLLTSPHLSEKQRGALTPSEEVRGLLGQYS